MSAESTARDHIASFSWYQGKPGMTREEAELRDLHALQKQIEELLEIKARNANENRVLTWQQIADIFGITRQAVMKRWKRKTIF